MKWEDGYAAWCLSRLARRIRDGWIYVDIGLTRCLIRPDRDCDLLSCPQAGMPHRHVPTLADREEAYDIISDWLRLRYDEQQAVEAAARFESQSRAELDRLFALGDPRQSTASDADSVSAHECRRICALNPPAREQKQGVVHTLNLLRGLQVTRRSHVLRRAAAGAQ